MSAGISFSGKNFRAELKVNGSLIELNPFTEQLLARTSLGAVSCLKGAETIESLELSLEHGDVRLVVNGNELQLAPFPKDIIANIVTAMVSSLKGTGRKLEKVLIRVHIG